MALYFRISNLEAYFRKLDKIVFEVIKIVPKINKIASLEYVEMLREAIVSQKYDFSPLSPAYRDWKDANYPGAYGFAHLAGDLLNSLRIYRKDGFSWVAGVNPVKISKGRKSWGRSKRRIPVVEYAAYFEGGTVNQPERPIFGTTLYFFMTTKWETLLQTHVPTIYKHWK